jgi:ribosomal protein S18 acetylase RimI-like enzyme
MQALVSELWRLEGPAVENHVGDLAWQRFQHTGRESEWRIRVWEEAGELAAWAWLRLPATLQYEIHPDHRNGPLHDELIAWFEAEAQGDELRTSSTSTDTERLTVLHRHGYEIDLEARTLCYFIRELDDVPIPAVPADYTLRTVRSGDLERRVEIHRVVWDPSRVTTESYANVMAAWPYRAELDCVVDAPEGSFAAYTLAWLDEANGVGELEPVGTHPDHRRLGLASGVCRFALRRLRDEGATRVIVYSWADTPAQALYESLGFREHARSRELVKRR